MDVARSRLVIVKMMTPALTGLVLLAGPSETMYWKNRSFEKLAMDYLFALEHLNM